MEIEKVIAYHSIGRVPHGEVGAELYCVQIENFRKQMRYVADSSLLIAHSKNKNSKDYEPRAKSQELIITFDDGDITNYTHAYPILKEFGIKAYFFILAGKVGSPGYMSWPQIKELRDFGMIIGSHGISHRILTELSDAELDYELKESKNFLSKNLSVSIDHLSIPRGFCNKTVIAKAKKTGYKKIFTSDITNCTADSYGRITVRADWNIEQFKRVLNNGYSLKEKAGELLKASSKRLLGAKRYDKLREGIIRTGQAGLTK